MREWNRTRSSGSVSFSAMISFDAVNDLELLQLCAEAGVAYVFIGIESTNVETLREFKKFQNFRKFQDVESDMIAQIRRLLDHGIMVSAGLIVGADSDGPDIFQKQYDFAMSSPIPIFGVGLLTAVPGTPLHDRMARSDRLVHTAFPAIDIIPMQMSRQRLKAGYQWLWQSLYHPAAFEQRVLNFIEYFRPNLHSPRLHRSTKSTHRMNRDA